MPEVQKYSINEKLEEVDRKFKGDPAVVGSTAMGFFRYTNSTRTQMLTTHINQIINILYPQFPKVMTGVENTAGKHSSGYKQLSGDIKIVKKIVKFEDIVDQPYVYQLFFWDYEKNQYDVVERREVKNLGQDYAYKYNNEVIDSLAEGDKVEKGTVLFKSNSYDDDMNYRFGRNLTVGYTLYPYTAEDAALIAEDVHYALTSTHSTIMRWNWNNNDIPINYYGGEKEYRPLPWIGEKVESIICCSRPQVNEQLTYDFTHKNLSKVREGDRTIEYNGRGIIVDYDIYVNSDEIEEDTFNAQILMLINAQNKYWQKIQDMCKEIADSGEKYSKKIDLLYRDSIRFLNQNPKEKWHNGSSVFGNIEFRAQLIDYQPLGVGGKFTARHGNKSVAAKVLPPHLMPFTKDGRRVDVCLNLLAITNRTTAFVLHEMHLTWAQHCLEEEMKRHTKIKEKEKLLWDFVELFNKDQRLQMGKTYSELPLKERKQYLEDVENGLWTLHQDMINEDRSVFYKLKEFEEKFSYAHPDDLYIYRWGHVYRMNSMYYLGQMYFFPLKQTDRRQFSVRATGAINMKGLPERSYKNKKNEATFSDTAIRFGETEAENFMIGMTPEEYACMQVMYRTSAEASSDLTKAQFAKRLEGQIKKTYKSRAAEIVNVLFKHLGFKMPMIDEDAEIHVLDSHAIRPHLYKDKMYLCTDKEFYMIELKDRLLCSVMRDNLLLTKDQLIEKLDEAIKNNRVLLGDPDLSVEDFDLSEFNN